jgi:hypothetical protein
MRVAVVYIAAGRSGRLKAMAEALARGFESSGHRVELLDAVATPLAAFDYVALGTEAAGLGARLPERVKTLLGQAYGIEGKRCLAFVRRSGFGAGKLLGRLMSAMEAAGMRVTYSDILADAAGAEMMAHNAPVERN